MADNYIERQYEQYEARKAAWEKKRKQGKKKTISVKLQPKDLTDNTIKLPRKAFITGGADGIGKNIVKAFCNSQYQVAFCDKNKETRSHTDNFGENNVKCLIAKGICRFVPHSSAGGF